MGLKYPAKFEYVMLKTYKLEIWSEQIQHAAIKLHVLFWMTWYH